MTVTLPTPTPGQIDEPHTVEEYADVLSRAAADRRPVIVRRGGSDFAAIVPLEYLEMAEEAPARTEAERRAGRPDWGRLVKTLTPSQEWLDRNEPKPF
jgi:hypothetical protein